MAVAVQAGDVDAVERLWRDKWQALDERGRGAVSFAELPQLLDELGVALTPQELEDAAARIQKWQGSRLLLQGFLRWFLGDGGGDRLLGQQKGDKRKLRAAEAEVAKLRGELDALRKEQADRVVTEARRKGDEAALVARAEAAEKLVDECRAEHAGAPAERDATLEAVRREGAAALAKAQTDGAAVDALRARPRRRRRKWRMRVRRAPRRYRRPSARPRTPSPPTARPSTRCAPSSRRRRRRATRPLRPPAGRAPTRWRPRRATPRPRSRPPGERLPRRRPTTRRSGPCAPSSTRRARRRSTTCARTTRRPRRRARGGG